MGQGLGLMSQREAQRLAVLQRVVDKRLSQAQAAAQLSVSVRQLILVSVQDETIYPWPRGETPECVAVCSESG